LSPKNECHAAYDPDRNCGHGIAAVRFFPQRRCREDCGLIVTAREVQPNPHGSQCRRTGVERRLPLARMRWRICPEIEGCSDERARARTQAGAARHLG